VAQLKWQSRCLGEGGGQDCEINWSGAIGDIQKWNSFNNRPIWPQGVNPPTGTMVPNTLDWELVTGPAETIYLYNSGVPSMELERVVELMVLGLLGIMACHILQSPYEALKLGYRHKSTRKAQSFTFKGFRPRPSPVSTHLPQRGRVGKIKLPEVDIFLGLKWRY